MLKHDMLITQNPGDRCRFATDVCWDWHVVADIVTEQLVPSSLSPTNSYSPFPAFLRQSDLYRLSSPEAPVSSNQLHPEDRQKQNKLTAGLAWALLRSTISRSAWRRYF